MPQGRALVPALVAALAVSAPAFATVIVGTSGPDRLTGTKRADRIKANIGRSFRWTSPDPEPPSLPDPQAIIGLPCALQGGGAGQARAPKGHDILELETSGLLDRLGYKMENATVERIFREPDSVRRAFESSARGSR